MRKLLLLTLLMTACTAVPDVPVCVELTDVTKVGNTSLISHKGWCAWTLTNKEQFVDEDTNLLDGKKWSLVKSQSLLVPADSWAKIKSYIQKNCKKNKDCDEYLGKWERSMGRIKK